MSRIKQDLSSSPYGRTQLAMPSTSPSSAGGTMLQTARIAAGIVPHVCVIGAGIAGLRCAEALIQRGMKVTLMEGRNRIGGRMHQSDHLGHVVDLGPNWIHGTENNPIMDLAKETQSTLHSWGERQAIFDEKGKMLEETKANRYSEIVCGIIADAFKYSNDNSSAIPPNRSLMDFFKNKVKGFLQSDSDGPGFNGDTPRMEELNHEQKTLLRIAQMWGAFIGDPIERQSLKFFWLEECIEGETLFNASTYKAILDRIAETAIAKAEIQFSTKVVGVESRRDEVIIRAETGSPQTFDEVVMTAPLGWLKRNQAAFDPALPPRLSEAIESLGYGHLEKVYITFPTAFWEVPTSPSNSRSLSDSSDSTRPGFLHWLHPLYTPQNPDNWNIEALNLSALPSAEAHPTLLFYIHGPCSLHLTSLLTEAQTSSYYDILTRFFEPYYSLLPNYSKSAHHCAPTKVLATQWSTDELSGYGSYTNFPVGLEEGDRDVEVIRDGEGMPDRRVWFAGEHTAPFVAIGTVTGAYWSGERAAERIAEVYGLGGEGVKDGERERKVEGKMEKVFEAGRGAQGLDAGGMNAMGL
ncbi:MAG: hypothetical protein M1836_004477 [Candelina mexicana]|nr:MAG: hypothetical protein M1836_004477 [Candelina mexicana]